MRLMQFFDIFSKEVRDKFHLDAKFDISDAKLGAFLCIRDHTTPRQRTAYTLLLQITFSYSRACIPSSF